MIKFDKIEQDKAYYIENHINPGISMIMKVLYKDKHFIKFQVLLYIEGYGDTGDYREYNRLGYTETYYTIRNIKNTDSDFSEYFL